MFKRLLHETLVHFLMIGAVIFIAFNLMNKRTSGGTKKIVIENGGY